MMKTKIGIAGLMIIAMTMPAFAKESCESLASLYDWQNRVMASDFAEGLADNSAPRATNRGLNELNSRTEQLKILEFMKQRNCPFPDQVGSMSLYLSPALECQTAMLKGDTKSPACEMKNWTPSAGH